MLFERFIWFRCVQFSFASSCNLYVYVRVCRGFFPLVICFLLAEPMIKVSNGYLIGESSPAHPPSFSFSFSVCSARCCHSVSVCNAKYTNVVYNNGVFFALPLAQNSNIMFFKRFSIYSFGQRLQFCYTNAFVTERHKPIRMLYAIWSRS